MAEVKVYIDGQMLLPEIASDMLSMVGWTDSKEVRYCTKNEQGEFVPYDIVLDSNRYLAYYGDEDVLLVISKNRNITLCINMNTFKLPGVENYDYFARTYYLSGIYTELSLPDINLEIHRIDKDWMHLQWAYNDALFEADISIFL